MRPRTIHRTISFMVTSLVQYCGYGLHPVFDNRPKNLCTIVHYISLFKNTIIILLCTIVHLLFDEDERKKRKKKIAREKKTRIYRERRIKYDRVKSAGYKLGLPRTI